MQHAINKRIEEGLEAVNISVAELEKNLGLERGQLQVKLASDRAPVLDLIDNICKTAGISMAYVMFEQGPVQADSPTQGRDGTPRLDDEQRFELFLIRLRLLIDGLSMPKMEVAKILGVSGTSLTNWKKRGMIAESNLRKLCAMEGIDYAYITDGDVSTEAGRASHEKLFEWHESAIKRETAELEAKLTGLQALKEKVAIIH